MSRIVPAGLSAGGLGVFQVFQDGGLGGGVACRWELMAVVNVIRHFLFPEDRVVGRIDTGGRTDDIGLSCWVNSRIRLAAV